MNRKRVLIFGKSKEKTKYYQSVFAIAGYEVDLCDNLKELRGLKQSVSPDLIFWSLSTEEDTLFKDFLAATNQPRGEKSPKLILATSRTDILIWEDRRVDLIFHEPVLIQDFLARVKEILEKQPFGLGKVKLPVTPQSLSHHQM